MIRRALVIAASAVALSAAGAMAFTRGGASRQNAETRGGFCPARPAGTEQSTPFSAKAEAHMSIDPRANATAGASVAPVIGADSLLAPAPAICRPKPDTTPAQRSVPW